MENLLTRYELETEGFTIVRLGKGDYELYYYLGTSKVSEFFETVEDAVKAANEILAERKAR